jgi:hypothetical protein
LPRKGIKNRVGHKRRRPWRKRTRWDESMIAHRYDGKMCYDFRCDFLEPLFLILKIGIILAIVLVTLYYLFT